ncbi:MAG: HlyD family secretion protein, partial [Solirubrobacterales bacterium]|nr:HlyD family secretion protein [Solirubrobacterales bacterium]
MIDLRGFRAMNAGRAFRAVLLFPLALLRAFVLGPWKLLKTLLSGGRKLLLSVRAWVLFVLLVIAALVTYYVLSDRDTPFTTDAYVQAYVIQVAPRVEGQVVYVHVRENQVVKKGELLFEIDPRPFAYRVALLEAKRVEAIQQVAQLESDLKAAKADDARLVAEEAYAGVVHKQEKEIFKQEATTDRRYVEAVQKYKAAQAALERSRAQVRKAEQALAARIGDEHALVAEVTAQLAQARLDLEWTRIYAPANGYVTNVQLREGFYVHVGTPVLTCIDGDQWWVVANYRENSLENVRPGQRVGLTFNTYPGRIFPGVVQTVGWGVNQGQSAPSGNLPAIGEPQNWIRLAQRFQV